MIPRLRGQTGQGLRLQYALAHRVDPGPELRQKTDVHARMMAANGWAGWLFALVLITFFLQAEWDRPLLAVPSALALVAVVGAYVLTWRRQTAAARRWVANPPGPTREVPPPRWLERGFTGRRGLWLIIGVVVVNVLIVGVLVLVLR